MGGARGRDGVLLPEEVLGRGPDRNARRPGAMLRTLARADGGPPGRLARHLPSDRALRLAHTVARGLPVDPLAAVGAPDPIDVLVPCHPKDLPTARVAVASVLRHLAGVVRELMVVVPDETDPPEWLRRGHVHLRRDSDLLDGAFGVGGRDRRALTDGFRHQMAVKWAGPLVSMHPTLVLDADTVLLRPRTWLVAGVQVLDCRAKHQPAFDRHSSRYLGTSYGRMPSFVTHHQLLQPDLLSEVLDAEGGRIAPGSLARWLEAGADDRPSEYQVYGAAAVSRHRDRVRPARWANTTFKTEHVGTGVLPPDRLSDEGADTYLSELEELLPTSASATFHHRPRP